jgi:hypothetical protein
MTAGSIHEVPQDRLREVLKDAYYEGVAHIEKHGTQLNGPFALALYDLTHPAGLIREDFPDTLRVLEVMARRRIAVFGTTGHDQPLDDPRYAIGGRPEHLSLLDITAIKAAEMLVVALPNHALLMGRDKWPGASASYGGELLDIGTGRTLPWELGIAGSGFAPHCDLRIVDGAAANLQYDLIASGEVVIRPVVSDTFVLGPRSTWSYPDSAD